MLAVTVIQPNEPDATIQVSIPYQIEQYTEAGAIQRLPAIGYKPLRAVASRFGLNPAFQYPENCSGQHLVLSFNLSSDSEEL